MGLVGSFTRRLKSFFTLGFLRQSGFTLGIYGAPNAGKTALANRMCADWRAETMGSVSEVPHETRSVERRTLVLTHGRDRLTLEVTDTPGLVSAVSVIDLELLWDLPEADARRRAKEATDGMLEAIRSLDAVDGMLLVLDGSVDPRSQVNETLVAHIRGRNLPHVVVANKSDLPAFDIAAVRKTFPRSLVVPVSALHGHNVDALYDALLEHFG